jgi:hypothetical protein
VESYEEREKESEGRSRILRDQREREGRDREERERQGKRG